MIGFLPGLRVLPVSTIWRQPAMRGESAFFQLTHLGACSALNASPLPVFEVAFVLVCLDHIASIVVNPDHSVM